RIDDFQELGEVTLVRLALRRILAKPCLRDRASGPVLPRFDRAPRRRVLELQPRCLHRVRRQRVPRHGVVTSTTVTLLWVKLGVDWSHRRRAGGDRAWRPSRWAVCEAPTTRGRDCTNGTSTLGIPSVHAGEEVNCTFDPEEGGPLNADRTPIPARIHPRAGGIRREDR